ncbi:MAG: hypothetical protein J5588_05990 [Bacteroidales bacterium]|nr:hypothetical protein [Bacteroidales bacterium]
MSGTTANLVNDTVQIDNGLDSIVVVKDLADIPGGATLDCSDDSLSDLKVIKAGHVIIKTNEGVYKPMPISGTGYGSKGGSDVFVGILKKSVLKDKPFAAIMTMGQMNKACSPYTLTSTEMNGLPNIQFI